MKRYALIMAGGEGSRFYPLSTPERPKQFLTLYGGKSLIQHTFERISPLFEPDKIFIATNERYLDFVREQIPEIRADRLLGEPLKKNTAPCIAAAAWLIRHIDLEASMCVFPSDHFIDDEEQFRSEVLRAAAAARYYHKIVTMGIQPDWPSTEYGYIKQGKSLDRKNGKLYSVDGFVEKPNEEKAGKYCNDGTYLWNSGIFIWKVDTILKEISVHLPGMHEMLQRIDVKNKRIDREDFNRFFSDVEGTSIDYGVMERSRNVIVLKVDFGWSDLGSIEALKRVVKSCQVKVNPILIEEGYIDET